MKPADALGRLLAGGALEPAEVRGAFASILAGDWTPVQVAGFAVALRMRGEDARTIVAAASAMRDAMSAVEHGLPLVADTCGTGGDGAHTMNISSVAAIVLAACGVPVAKHGNRSVSSRCGSADVMEALGIPIDVPIDKQKSVLREAGIAFLFAPAHHPALKHAGQARRELGVRTIFNALGPLVNPARATHQLVGVYDDALRPVVARALGDLGVVRAWVVRSEDGLDEISPAAPTRVSVLEGGAVTERTVTPEDFGLEPVSLDSLAGEDAAGNARAIEAILRGEAHPAWSAVVLNAAAAWHVVSGEEVRASVERVKKVLAEGAGNALLEKWRRVVAQAKVA